MGRRAGFEPRLFETEIDDVRLYVRYRRALRKLWEKRTGRKAWRVRDLDGLTVFVPDAIEHGVRLFHWAESTAT